MEIKEILGILVIFLLLPTYVIYVMQIFKKEVKPTLSTWIIFSAATAINAISYLVATEIDYLSGVFLLTDAVSCSIICLMSVIFNRSSVKFKPFEKYYLFTASMVVIFWFFTHNAFISNLLIQGLILVAFFPTAQNMITSKENTESFTLWTVELLASAISLYPAMVDGNLLSTIYSFRCCAEISVLLLIMRHYHLKNKITAS